MILYNVSDQLILVYNYYVLVIFFYKNLLNFRQHTNKYLDER